MSDLFGAPLGIIASDKNVVDNLTGALHAQKLLGEIAQQPADLEVKQAHAKLYGAQAAEHEGKVRDLAIMDALQRKFAEGRVQAARDGTLPDAAVLQPSPSLATPLEEMARLADAEGAPLRLTTQYRKDAALIRQREAQKASSDAEAQLRQGKLVHEQAMQRASWAQAMLDNPEQYAMMRMKAASEGKDVTGMPNDWAVAKPGLEQIVTEGRKIEDIVKAKAKAVVDKAQVAKFEAQAEAASASASTAKQREQNLKQTFDFMEKNGGNASAEVRDLRHARTEAAKAVTAKQKDADDLKERAQRLREDKAFNPLSPEQLANPKQRRVGETYKLPTGPHTWTGTGWIPLRSQAPARAPAASAAVDDDADTESDDDSDDTSE